MYKHSNGLPCLQLKYRNRVLDYGKINWYCGIKNFKYEYFSLLKKMLK